MEPILGVLALCATMVGVLVWIIKSQQKTINNHLDHVETAVNSLPCRNRPDCPEGHDGDRP